MKRIYLSILVILLILVGCGSKDPIKYESAQAVQARLDQKETVVLVVGATTCPACATYKEVLRELLSNYTINLTYIEWNEQSHEAIAALERQHNVTVTATPMTFIFEDGTLIFSEAGAFSYRETKTLLEKHGFLKE